LGDRHAGLDLETRAMSDDVVFPERRAVRSAAVRGQQAKNFVLSGGTTWPKVVHVTFTEMAA